MQHLGLISILILVFGLTVTYLNRPAGLEVTFSQRIANSKQAEIFYSILFTFTLPLLFLFFAEWFVPNNNLPEAFLWFTAIAVIFQIVCTWVPERGGKMTTIHRLLTSVSGISLLPLVWFLATTEDITSGLRYTAWTVLILMALLLMIALANQKGFRYALLLQLGYYALFFAIVLLVTYL